MKETDYGPSLLRFGLISRRFVAVVGALSTLPAILLLRGFTVDDAWIPARYAAHLAAGLGYRFNPSGAATDGVTPLFWAPLLALLGGWLGMGGAWWTARILGIISWILTAALLSREAHSLGGARARWLMLLPVPLSAPLAAWSVAGLETGVVTLLTTLAALLRPGPSCVAIGLAATFRPEMILLAFAFAIWRFVEVRQWRLFFFACTPWCTVVALRLVFFDRPVPLSALAKPSDLSHGFLYVLAGFLLGGTPILALPSLGAWRRSRDWVPLVSVALTHALALVLAGGDWMPLSRLLVPSFPLWILAALRLASRERSAVWALGRASLAVSGMLFAWWRVGPAASSVVTVRGELIAQARPVLRGRSTVVSLDIGWVGAAFPGRIVDLAGLTDPAIAVLPGGHTSKRVTGAMLADRGADALLLLRRQGCEGSCIRSDGGPFERAVEERIAHDFWVTSHFQNAGELRAGSLVYVVFLPVLESSVPTP